MAILDRNAQFKLELIRIELEMLDQKYLDDKRTRPNAGYILDPTMQPRNITVNVCNHEEQKKNYDCFCSHFFGHVFKLPKRKHQQEIDKKK